MRIEQLDEFVFRVKELCVQNPDQVRYTLKYRNSIGQIVAKATDDKVVLTYKTDQRADLYNLDQLNQWFFTACTGLKRARLDSDPGEQQQGEENGNSKEGEATHTETGATAQTTSTSQNNNNKKKKKKRGKR